MRICVRCDCYVRILAARPIKSPRNICVAIFSIAAMRVAGRLLWDQVHMAIVTAHAFDLPPAQTPAPKPAPTCCHCGGKLQFIAMLRPADYASRTTRETDMT